MFVPKAVSRGSLRFVPGVLAGLVLLSAAAAQQAPAPDPAPQFGSWQLQCDPPAGPGKQCALVQTASPAQNPDLYANVLLIRLDKSRLLLRIIAPLGVLVPTGVGLNIDGNDVGTTGFTRCHLSGCLADVLVTEALRKSLLAGSSASLTLHQTPETALDFIFKLDGTGRGLAALPPPPAARAGTQP
ncbi:invasion associated locus B family protein [Labrys okinawensis]|uniref:invasion associated locus B family protein n=1 Tax=Labrys okinawensis TaxID=346911 RepID=UPI0039BC3067